jgi:hypothetical protein
MSLHFHPRQLRPLGKLSGNLEGGFTSPQNPSGHLADETVGVPCLSLQERYWPRLGHWLFGMPSRELRRRLRRPPGMQLAGAAPPRGLDLCYPLAAGDSTVPPFWSLSNLSLFPNGLPHSFLLPLQCLFVSFLVLLFLLFFLPLKLFLSVLVPIS